MGLKDRLRFDSEAGAVYDGDRRYVLMRPDVLMGVVRALDASTRAAALAKWSAVARAQGAASLRAYQDTLKGDHDALIHVVESAARDLGWGAWQISQHGGGWQLVVHDSPFAQGHGPCEQAVCAPVAGLFGALLDLAGGATHEVAVIETACAAQGRPRCIFRAVPGGVTET